MSFNMGNAVNRRCPLMSTRREDGNVSTPSEHGLFYGGGNALREPAANRRRDDSHFHGRGTGRLQLRGRRRAAPGWNSSAPGPSTSASTAPKNTDKSKEKPEQQEFFIKIHLGVVDMDGHYFSPYPEVNKMCSKLHICEYCFKCMRTSKMNEHLANCFARRNPPGREIYRKDGLTIREVDGEESTYYCYNLCLLSKLFLEDKLINPEVKLFYFYILTQDDKNGPHMVGYFSKPKDMSDGCNLSCFLVLPPYRKLGFGKFLIDFSYTLSKVQGFVGTPERPFSDLGELAFRSYWSWALLEQLKRVRGNDVSIAELTRRTAIQHMDIISTLKELTLLRKRRGRSIVQVDPKLVVQCLTANGIKQPLLMVDPECLKLDPECRKLEPPFKKVKTNGEGSSQGACSDEDCTNGISIFRNP